MHTVNLEDVLDQLRASLERGDIDQAKQMLDSLRSPDQADLIEELDDEDVAALLPKLDPAKSADIIEDLEDADAAEVIASLPLDTAAHILDEMEPDEAADVLGDLPPEQAHSLLAGLEEPQEIHPLLLHSDESAGGLMTSEFLALRPRMTAGQAIEAIRAWKPDAESIYYLFVVDEEDKLCGVVNLRQLIIADPASPIANLMDPDVISVPVGTDQEECGRLMSRYDLLALPVVDEAGVLMGVITVDDVMEALEDEATEDIQRLGGSQPLDQPYLKASIFSVVRKRIGWLLLLFVTGSLTGTVMRLYENELKSVVALTFFVPLLIGTGGNAGSQVTSTIIRSLAVGEIDLADALRALWHELRVGLVLGLGMGAIAYLRAVTWGVSPDIAIAVSMAIAAIVLWANGMGSLLPMLATRLGIDPTVVSGPVMSTLVDATGLLIYFTIARLILGL